MQTWGKQVQELNHLQHERINMLRISSVSRSCRGSLINDILVWEEHDLMAYRRYCPLDNTFMHRDCTHPFRKFFTSTHNFVPWLVFAPSEPLRLIDGLAYHY